MGPSVSACLRITAIHFACLPPTVLLCNGCAACAKGRESANRPSPWATCGALTTASVAEIACWTRLATHGTPSVPLASGVACEVADYACCRASSASRLPNSRRYWTAAGVSRNVGTLAPLRSGAEGMGAAREGKAQDSLSRRLEQRNRHGVRRASQLHRPLRVGAKLVIGFGGPFSGTQRWLKVPLL